MKKLQLIGLVMVLIACSSSRQDTTAQDQVLGQPLEYEILLEESYGGTDKPENRVITTQKELESVYAVINRMRRPGIAVPQVDFSKKTVVAVFMGKQSSGGNRVEIKKIAETGDTVEIHVRKIHPGEGDMTTMAITQPFVFAEIPVSDKKVIFK